MAKHGVTCVTNRQHCVFLAKFIKILLARNIQRRDRRVAEITFIGELYVNQLKLVRAKAALPPLVSSLPDFTLFQQKNLKQHQDPNILIGN